MKVEMGHGLRAKLAWAFILSGALSVLGLAVIWVLAGIMHRYEPFRSIFDLLEGFPGIPALVMVTSTMLFVTIFFVITRSTALYLDEITRTMRLMEEGDWSYRIPVRFKDELGLIANGVNRMAAALSQSISDIRKAELARSELVTSVSHDLRTPLTSIIGYLGLIVEEHLRGEPFNAQYAAIAHQKALKLQELIDELFEFTRLNYGGIRKSGDPIDLCGLVAQVAEELFPLFEDAGMECRIAPSKRIPVIADGAMLARAFENLFTNAIRYGRQGRFIDVDFASDERGISVRLRNYGESIPEKDLPRIFDRFYRGEQTGAASIGGAGLGLAIVKGIVELHEGTISVSSGEGVTCFEVILPVSMDS